MPSFLWEGGKKHPNPKFQLVPCCLLYFYLHYNTWVKGEKNVTSYRRLENVSGFTSLIQKAGSNDNQYYSAKIYTMDAILFLARNN